MANLLTSIKSFFLKPAVEHIDVRFHSGSMKNNKNIQKDANRLIMENFEDQTPQGFYRFNHGFNNGNQPIFYISPKLDNTSAIAMICGSPFNLGSKTAMYLTYFVVDKKYRRQGYGALLLESVMDYAKEQNIDYFVLTANEISLPLFMSSLILQEAVEGSNAYQILTQSWSKDIFEEIGDTVYLAKVN